MSRAAKNLNLSQSGLSQSLDKLEAELGVQLFQRTRLGSRPTLAGLKVITRAKEIEKQLGLMQTDLSELAVPTAPFRLGVMNEVPSTLLDWLLKFQAGQPNFRAYLAENTVREIIRAVKAQEYDAGLIAVDQAAVHLLDGLDFRAIGSGQFKLYTTANHYLANYQGPLPLELVLEQEFALFIDDYIAAFVKKLARQTDELNVIVQSTSFRVILETMRKFQAVSIIRDTQIDRRLYASSADPLIPHEIADVGQVSGQHFRYGIITRAGQSLTPLQEKFLQGIRF
ncbi:LysR family transcriptional regulator [Ligilactobacillus pabuli]|uniref:LysR family transcriptional regulator n=1 Tax=Ligilactobacillus pabuli TaxID=2886039 RepID=UPI0022474C8A|nr:LysR family transcriptional regulator [Ligilactobacillus pabuli]